MSGNGQDIKYRVKKEKWYPIHAVISSFYSVFCWIFNILVWPYISRVSASCGLNKTRGKKREMVSDPCSRSQFQFLLFVGYFTSLSDPGPYISRATTSCGLSLRIQAHTTCTSAHQWIIVVEHYKLSSLNTTLIEVYKGPLGVHLKQMKLLDCNHTFNAISPVRIRDDSL